MAAHRLTSGRTIGGCRCGGAAPRMAALCGARGAAIRGARCAAAGAARGAAAGVARVRPPMGPAVRPVMRPVVWPVVRLTRRPPPTARTGELPRRSPISGDQAAESRRGARGGGHSSSRGSAKSRCGARGGPRRAKQPSSWRRSAASGRRPPPAAAAPAAARPRRRPPLAAAAPARPLAAAWPASPRRRPPADLPAGRSAARRHRGQGPPYRLALFGVAERRDHASRTDSHSAGTRHGTADVFAALPAADRQLNSRRRSAANSTCDTAGGLTDR
jgi:hypothetical protein